MTETFGRFPSPLASAPATSCGRDRWTSLSTLTVACPKGINCPKSNGPDFDFPDRPPFFASLSDGRCILVAGQKSGVVTALDPDHGGGNRLAEEGRQWQLQTGAACNGASQLMKITSMSRCQTPNSTPWLFNNSRRACLGPALSASRCSSIATRAGDFGLLKLETGEEVWRTSASRLRRRRDAVLAQSAAVTAIPGLVFSGGLDGHLRAYFAFESVQDSLGMMDTKGDYQGVNGVSGQRGLD